MTRPALFDFFRSTAAWRVRIALNLKRVEYDHKSVWIRGEAHTQPDYLAINPHGLVPALDVDGCVIPQSLAIIEYLEARYPDPPLLPKDELARARVRSAALLIACDIHPVNNRRVLTYLRDRLSLSDEQVRDWEFTWVSAGFRGLEEQVRDSGDFAYLFGNSVTLADICLVPQVANGKRAGVSISDYPTLNRAYRQLIELPAFVAAAPENQPDAPKE
ncbi:MAG: maleylacetoacetate isomerase [Hyphomonas sp.]